jgi:hypothetical protein
VGPQSWVDFFRAILLEQYAEQLIGGDRNDQKATRYANYKRPAQEVSGNLGQEIEHIYVPQARCRDFTTNRK